VAGVAQGMASRRKVTLHLQPPTWGMPTCHPDFLQVLAVCARCCCCCWWCSHRRLRRTTVARRRRRSVARMLARSPPPRARTLLTECGRAGADVLQGR